ncbi:siderophore biosynthesis protein (plasmid) [Phyllobacterium zundukense]|uniref:GNAT family N-acetyltransferase n=1 Tax=Phyllobacterium zundukense TaxID=1867719 RepID=UPI000C1C36C2|nr:GNAT family N-acetyltransferase [Phyllobacterium zundukense]ATU95940.1 siderophore biosynthesis protein [Phyllobacterium zundukense]
MTLISNLARETRVEPFPVSTRFLITGSLLTPDRLQVSTASGAYTVSVQTTPEGLKLVLPDLTEADPITVLSCAVEFMTAQSHEPSVIGIGNMPASDFPLGTFEDNRLMIDPRAFWQWPAPWVAKPAYPHPQVHVLSNGQYHPKRPQKPVGVVYERYIPWLGQVLSFRVADPQTDLEDFHRWMNDEQVNVIWEDGGDRQKHLAILEERLHDPHMLALIGCFNGVPFGYFEVYWAKENRLGPYYDAQDYDRGWHVAIGEPAYRGKQWITAWLPSLMHFIFLDDPRTQRIVGEPRASHEQQIRNLDRSGFAKVKHFDFPHKRAMLVMLTRERFFGDRLWVPAS